jgi:hypothetical protein
LAVAAAIAPSEWPRRQALDVPAPGVVRVELTPASFDSALPSLNDFRVYDPEGRWVPYLLDEPPAGSDFVPNPKFSTEITDGRTIVTVETGTTRPLATLELTTPAPVFMRAVQIEASADGEHWDILDRGAPFFRKWGTQNIEFPLARRIAARLRVTIAEGPEGPLPVNSVALRAAPELEAALIPVGARIVARAEYLGVTELTVALDGRHLPVARVTIETPEPLFTRFVTIGVRQFHDGSLADFSPVGRAIYRVALDGSAAREELSVPIQVAPAGNELIIRLRNGDSPPLAIDSVKVERRPLNLLFRASSAGRYYLLSGNARALQPFYDLAKFSAEMHAANAVSVAPGPVEPVPGYQPATALAPAPSPEVPLAGAPFDDRAWSVRRRLVLAQPGVEELELDLGCLGGAKSDFSDLRIVHEGRQIPYVVEHTRLQRTLTAPAVPVPDRRRPTFSVWRVDLPQAALQLQTIQLSSPTTLFQRDFRVYENAASPQGEKVEYALGSSTWHRLPAADAPGRHIIDLKYRLSSGTLWLETDNGDNPAIELGMVEATYPVVRLVFKVGDTAGYTLEYGNAAALPPRYDLSLVEDELLATIRNPVKLPPVASLPPPPETSSFAPRGLLFWGALALVVVVLLVVVGKLLPKPPAA